MVGEPTGPWRVRLRRWRRAAAAGLAFFLLADAGLGSGDRSEDGAARDVKAWCVGQPLAVAVSDGKARFDVPTPRAGSKVLVVVSALARTGGPFPLRLEARPTDRIQPVRLTDDGPSQPPQLELPALPALPPTSGIIMPPIERTFHLLVKDGDPASASNYRAVRGRLRAVGHRVQVYVDPQDLALVSPETLRDVVATFDERVYPEAAGLFGPARDVDGDGRFTILMSSWLSRLAGGRLAVDGFVRGADFDPGLGAPFGNHCDLLYLSASLHPGPHLRTVLAHEYTHAVTFCRKVGDRKPTDMGPPAEEEGWLDEALAHLVEDRHGFSRSNLDYRVSAFLSIPERYRLVVEDYYRADLFRSHGNRGSTYLFLRWCADRFGPNLLPALVRSNRRGIANLEAATGATFPALYRRWSTSLYLDALAPKAETGADEDGEWLLAGPRPSIIEPGGPADVWSAEVTTSHYAVVTASPTGQAAIEVVGPPEAALQVTAVPLPDDLPRLQLSARVETTPDGEQRLRAIVEERDGQPVELVALSWERLVPPANPHTNGFHVGRLDRDRLTKALGGSAMLPALGRKSLGPIAMPQIQAGDGPFIVKLVGIDLQGRRVVAWAESDPASPSNGPNPRPGLAIDVAPQP